MLTHAQPSPEAANLTDISNLVVYPSWIMRNALASLVNLVTLLIGIAIGVALAPHFERHAQASSVVEQQTSPPAVSPNTPEQFNPGIMMGSLGVNLVLAHHIQSDELVVNGVDIIKLHQGELNLLSRISGPSGMSEVNNIITNARDTHVYQVPPPKPQSQTPAQK